MSNPLITINLVVLNGEKYIQHFWDSVLAQTYPYELMELNILDNGSTDATKKILKELASFDEFDRFTVVNSPNHGLRIPKFYFVESKENLGMWPGQEELLKHTNGKYVITSAVDVILDKDFIKNAVEVMEKYPKVGALQPKIYKFDLCHIPNIHGTSGVKAMPSRTSQIDTCGFKIFKSRRVVNIGHGFFSAKTPSYNKSSKDKPESKEFDFGKEQEIFAVEGAVPVFRKEALESCRINVPYSEIADHDYFWYGDDLDLAWRMRLFGWKEIFAPNVVAWHDRQTTKTLKQKWLDYFSRISIRRQIPIKKRRLDWRNNRWTLVKNDYMINVLRDLPWIVFREVAVLGYTVLFEPGILKEIPSFFKYLPTMLKKRREIMNRAIVGPKELRKWMN